MGVAVAPVSFGRVAAGRTAGVSGDACAVLSELLLHAASDMMAIEEANNNVFIVEHLNVRNGCLHDLMNGSAENVSDDDAKRFPRLYRR